MTVKEFQRLKALMMMTTSAQDGEALNALRLANAMLVKDNRNWEEVLDQLVTVTTEAKLEEQKRAAAPGAMSKSPEEIEEALTYMLDHLRPGSSFLTFIQSLHAQWEAKSYLTQRQIEVLFNAYEKQSGGESGWKRV